MDKILEIINVIGVFGAVFVSAIALFSTKKLQTMGQQVTIMAQKRSSRIDLMRKYSSEITSNAKLVVYGIATPVDNSNLVKATSNFIALLQYEYKYDIELIDMANDLLNCAINATCSNSQLLDKIDEFWQKCDLYVGVEFERLKNESLGMFNKSGEIKDESLTFDGIYEKLFAEQRKAIEKRKNK